MKPVLHMNQTDHCVIPLLTHLLCSRNLEWESEYRLDTRWSKICPINSPNSFSPTNPYCDHKTTSDHNIQNAGTDVRYNTVNLIRVTAYDYTKVLRDSLLFYEAQRSGKLPSDQKVTWRKDSALNDKEQKGEDLTGGYYDGKCTQNMYINLTYSSWNPEIYQHCLIIVQVNITSHTTRERTPLSLQT
jgi:hypothetical protein